MVRFALILLPFWLFCLLGWNPEASAGQYGEDLVYAPKSFTSNGKLIVPVDFGYSYVDFTFDVPNRRAYAKARIEFFAREAGYPMLDLVPSAQVVRLNGETAGLQSITSPDNGSNFRYVTLPVREISSNLLEIEYELNSRDVTFSSNGARIGFFMSDVSSDREYWEQFAPANFEYDSAPLEVTVKILGGTAEHQLFANGEIQKLDSGFWKIIFPPYFTASSMYLHLSDRPFIVREGVYNGLNGAIPLTIYSDSTNLAESGLSRAKSVLEENEKAFGAFAHPKFVAYITSNGGGMEYCGATVTSLGALGHEITHSWFARGVMPANGNAGWIDEAVASWRDNGYPRYSSLPNSTTNMGNLSPYRRTTVMAAYSQGASLMAHFDYKFSGTGLKTVLRSLFSERQHTVITSDFLLDYFEKFTGQSLGSLFSRYVFGKGRAHEPKLFPLTPSLWEAHPEISHHPRPFTKAERAALR